MQTNLHDERERYAATLGPERREYISLSLIKKLSPPERLRMKELLANNRAKWSEHLGINLSRQRWARGFVVRALVSDSATSANLAHPEWGFVEEIPGNSRLPSPDLMNALTLLHTFNSASWLAKRRTPWAGLRTLRVRLAEAELIRSERERFPVLQEAELYLKPGELNAESVTALATHIESLVLIGPPPEGGLAALVDRFADSALRTLVYAPNQRLNGAIKLSRNDAGAFREFKELPRSNRASVRSWLGEMPRKSLDRLSSKLTPAECEPWLRSAQSWKGGRLLSVWLPSN